MNWKHLLFLASIACWIGCGDDPINTPYPDLTREYFPLKVGSSITYQVDSIVFDDAPGGNKLDTTRFLLKEEIAAKEMAENGDSVFIIHRFKRADESQSWVLADVWTANINGTEALRTEENLKFRKLSFPLRYGKRWKSTAYINPETQILVGTEYVKKAYEEWEAEVLSFDKSGIVGNFTFGDSTVMTLDQTNMDDGTMKRYVNEIYVRNIGLVARVDSILESRCIDLGYFEPCLGKPWVEHADKGYILSQVMIAYQ